MKKILFVTSLVLALALMSVAQSAKRPPFSHHLAGSLEPVEVAPPTTPPTPPGLCAPCLFYGGDLNPADANAAGLSDENTLLIVGGGNTYTAYRVPTGGSVSVTGILVNVQADANFDPNSATYDVRTGISDGNGGTSIASGSGQARVASTGLNFLGVNEFTVLVKLSSALTLTAGEYWFNVTPQCTNGATDGSCYVGRFFISNTTQETNGVKPFAQPGGSMFFNSSFFGFTYANWCDSSLGLNNYQCHLGSFGLTGTTLN